jgi:hypothetical protein
MFNFIEYLDNCKIFYTYKEPSVIIRPSVLEYSYDSFLNYLNRFNPGEIEIYSEEKKFFIPLIESIAPITIVIDRYSIYMRNGIVYVMFNGIITQLKFLIKQPMFRRCIWEYYNETPLVVERLVSLGYISNEGLKNIINEFEAPF